MSKFIRTKEGIENLVYNSEFDYYVTMHTETIISKDHIGMYQTADTIEELCDEFVLYFDCEDDKIRNRYMIEDELDDVNARLDIIRSWNEYEEPKVIYGAIWTDKGLIFVAKLNDKGDLELI